MPHEFQITPEPADDDRAAVLLAVEKMLRREAEIVRPPVWRLSGWLGRRAGITDVARSTSDQRRWPLSSRLPWGGREFVGLNGRGDAK